MQNEFDLTGIYHDTVPSLLSELATTPPMERLKQVGMNCGCEYTAFPRFANSGSYSRWVHSLGVGLIVWHFTGDPAQAAAGLLHDIATPPFAHVVDFLRGDYLVQEATEDGTRDRIDGSAELRAVLSRHGLTVDDVCDYHRYPVADNDSPRLSADRLEYSLGNAIRWGFLTREEIAAIYHDLRVGVNEEGAPELVFGNPAPASRFARAALECSKVYVSDEDRYAMQALCELIGRAMKTGVLSPADLEGTEPPLIAKLEASPLAADWRCFRCLSRIRRAEKPPFDSLSVGSDPLIAPVIAGGNDAAVPAAEASGDASLRSKITVGGGVPDAPKLSDTGWRQIPAKKRRIDPLVEGLGRVSSLDAAFQADLTDFLSWPQDEWLLAE